MERDIKQEQENHDSKQTNCEEVDKLMAYIAELGRQLATQKEAEEKRIQELQVAQLKKIERKDTYIRKLEERFAALTDSTEKKVETEKEVSEEQPGHEVDLSEREKEIGRKENYLKQLERELQNKENEIRTILNLDKIADENSREGQKTESNKESQIDSGNKEVTKPKVVTDELVEQATKTEVTHLVKPFVNSFSGIDHTPKN